MPQKMIGLLGGMSWVSSAQYYQIINQRVRDRLGGVHAAHCLLWSFDFAEIEAMQREGRWDDAAAVMVDAAQRLEQAGADIILICANTMHRMADAVQAGIGCRLLHIVDPTAELIRAAGYRRVGLLGTAYTMEQDFYRGRFASRYGMEVLVPDAEDRAMVHRIIFEELVQGQIRQESQQAYRDVMARLAGRGAKAVIFGCTEISLLVGPADCSVPVFDTTMIHAEAAVDWALS